MYPVCPLYNRIFLQTVSCRQSAYKVSKAPTTIHASWVWVLFTPSLESERVRMCFEIVLLGFGWLLVPAGQDPAVFVVA